MKVNVTQKLLAVDGSPLLRKDEAGKVTELNLRTVICEALLTSFRDEQNLSADKKQYRFKLAQRVMREDDLNISVEDIALCKILIGTLYGPVVVGPAFDLLEGVASALPVDLAPLPTA